MLFMNTWEVDEAEARFRNHPVLSKATRFLAQYRDQVNRCSDGWAHWRPPVDAAKQLIELIQAPETATLDGLKKALRPIKAFYTRHGEKAGMQYPTVDIDGGEDMFVVNVEFRLSAGNAYTIRHVKTREEAVTIAKQRALTDYHANRLPIVIGEMLIVEAEKA